MKLYMLLVLFNSIVAVVGPIGDDNDAALQRCKAAETTNNEMLDEHFRKKPSAVLNGTVYHREDIRWMCNIANRRPDIGDTREPPWE